VIRRIVRWLSGRPFVVMLIMVAVVTVPGFLRVQGIAREQERIIECTQAWGDASVERTTLLGGLAGDRTDALDRLVRAVASQDEEQFAMALAAYLAASDAYRDALVANPVPEPPSLRCG
jgi:type II secretory pathway pseudopilin PulG